jgi:hypothetical protein
MNKGYQILEPNALHSLFGYPLYHVFALATMTWLCRQLSFELQDHIGHVHFEVIRAEYMGPYPAIGIQYKSEDYQDIAPLAEETINRILRQKSALELLKFIAESEVDWNKLAVKMLASTG